MTKYDTDAINAAVDAFRALLVEQTERQKRIAAAVGKDRASKEIARIALIPGDGIGPIITESAKQALSALLEKEKAAGKVVFVPVSGMTIAERLACGKTLPDEALETILSCDVLLKGPTETPHGGNFESANVALRRTLDLYANVRPVRLPEKGIDWTFFRENSEGEYILGSRGIELPGGMSVDFKVTTPEGTRRIAEAAFSYARQNGKKKLAIVTKANIMKKTDGLFSKIAHEIAANYPEIEVGEWYIDIMTANLVNEAVQKSFEVFLLPNLYGDILTDEAAQICGGVGTAGSANIGDRCAMFEAIHGTAPRMIEEGLGAYASPVSILRAASMMLRHIGYAEKAALLENAIDKAYALCPVNGTKDGATCAEYTETLLRALRE